MSALRDKYAIVGTGKSRLGQVGANSLALLEEAIKNALDEAGLTNKDVDGVVVRGPDDVYSHHQQVAARLGVDASFSTSLDNGGASQILSIILAVMAIEAGLATTVVCGYGRDSWSRTHVKSGAGLAQNDLIPAAQRPREHGPEFGHFGAVSQHAFGARRHMFEYGTTRDEFAAIATAFREHALRNPEAQMKKPMTIEDYYKARWSSIRLACSIAACNSDGAGAVVVTSIERATLAQADARADQGLCHPQQHQGLDRRGPHAVDRCGRQRRTRLQDGRARAEGRRHRADLRLLHLHGPDAARGLRLLQEGRGRRVCPVRRAAHGRRRCRPTPRAASSRRRMWRACCRSSRARGSCRASIPERQVTDAEIALISGHGGNQVCHSTLILGRA